METTALLLTLVLFLTGCEQREEVIQLQNQEKFQNKFQTEVLHEYKKSESFELPNNCYFGAFIEEDTIVNGDVEKFEYLTSVAHEIYAKKMQTEEEFPLVWALEMYTQGKMPLISLIPKNRNDPFNKEVIMETAKSYGAFQVPIILEFYPNPSVYGLASDYLEFFSFSRDIFKESAPNVTFLWSVSLDEVKVSLDYYPKEDVEWIGLQVLVKNGQVFEDIEQNFDNWYDTYQFDKPLMLSSVGVSHYSTSDCKYTEKEAITTMDYIYKKVRKYNNIKAVLYMSEDQTKNVPLSTVRENYSLTDNNEILKNYTNFINNS